MALSDVLGVLAGSFGAGLSEYGAEQQRRQELARKKAEDERIKQATEALFRGGDVTPELAGAAITAGVSPTVVGSAQMFGRRQEGPQEPVLTVQPYLGGTARMKDGVFDSWVIRPPQEREAPTGPTPSDIRTARSELRGAESGFRATMGQRPQQRQFVDPVSGLPDAPAFEQAMKNWRADSTYAAGRRQQASEELAGLTGRPAGGTAAGGMADAGVQRAVAAEMQRIIQAIVADPTLSEAEKRRKIQLVNERASSFLRR